MSLLIKDFVPEKTKGGLFKSSEVQKFEEVLKEANAWIEANKGSIKMINVETLLLPNIHESDEEGSTDTELWTAGESSSHWYQLIRLWYEKA